MLWCYGTEDRVVSPRAIQAEFARLANPTARDQTIRRFDGYYHELHNEPERERQVVVDVVRAWLTARIP